MTQTKPNWFDEWVIADITGWHLKNDAPDEVKKAYVEYIKEYDNAMTLKDVNS